MLPFLNLKVHEQPKFTLFTMIFKFSSPRTDVSISYCSKGDEDFDKVIPF